MGDMWFPGLFPSQNFNSFGLQNPQGANANTIPFNLAGGLELQHLLSLNSSGLSITPQSVSAEETHVPSVIRSAIAKDPYGLSFDNSTLNFLKNPPPDATAFGV